MSKPLRAKKIALRPETVLGLRQEALRAALAVAGNAVVTGRRKGPSEILDAARAFYAFLKHGK